MDKFKSSFAGIAYAATVPTGVITSPTDVVTIACGVLKWMFWGLIVLSVAMFLYGGYMYAMSSGESEKVSKATKTLTFAAISVVVAIVAYGIPVLIGSLLGVSGGLSSCG